MNIFKNLMGKKENERLDSFAYYTLLISTFLLPLLTYTWAAVSPSTVKLAIGGVLLLLTAMCAAAALIQRQELTIPKYSLLGLVWLLPLAYLISTLFAGDGKSMFGSMLSMDSLAFFAVGALVLTVSAVLLRSQQRILGLYLTMLASATTLSIIQIVLFFARPAVEASGVILTSLSLLGTLNDLAVFFGVIIIFTLISLLALPVTAIVRAILGVVLALSLFFCSVVNLTVLWWIIGLFGLGCFVYSISTAYMSGVEAKKGISFAALATLIVAAIFLFGPMTVTELPSKWADVGELEIRPSWQSTVSVGRSALADNMIFGAGPGSFQYQWSKHIPSEIHATMFWRHDFPYGVGFIPTSIVSTGLVGVVAWLLFFASLLWMGFKTFLISPQSKDSDLARYVRTVAWFGAVYLWMIAIIQVPSPALVLIAFVFTGVFLASLIRPENPSTFVTLSFRKNPRIGFLTTLLLTLVLLVAIGGVYGFSTRFFAEVRFNEAMRVINSEKKVDEGEQMIIRATALYPKDEYYRILSDIDLYRINVLLNSRLEDAEAQERLKSLLARTIANATEATERGPKNYRNWSNLASKYQSISTLNIDGSAESAIGAYQRAIEMRPGAPDLLLALATLERSQGNIEQARVYVEQAISMRRSYTDAIFFLAQLQLESNDVANAINSVHAITLFEPKNPVAFFQLGLLHYGAGDYKNAETALSQAVRLANEYANARYFLGLTYWRLERTNESIAEFEKVLETNPENNEVRAIISNLRAGNAPLTVFASSTPAADIQERDSLPITEVTPESQENGRPEQLSE